MATRLDPATRLCRLAAAVGEHEACGEGSCPFWEPGGAVLDGRCAVERLDLDERPEAASWLLQIRGRLGPAASEAEASHARRQLYELLDTGDADGG